MNKRKSSRQEAEEPARCAEQAAVQVSALQNGDRAPKRPEKRRQSLGGFLKGLVGGGGCVTSSSGLRGGKGGGSPQGVY